ncbi:MAG: hypothetical protein D3905_04170 [Candidatus Electrothrix sp. AS4_5]|nr:hypothetical protein [Candidatus Electrothrix gigas]MCI5188992.1 hypothetical protein [Candidatus Electrothrix gigas]
MSNFRAILFAGISRFWSVCKQLVWLVATESVFIYRSIFHLRKGNILLLKTWDDHLGDIILILGTLPVYRKLFPDVKLHLALPDPYCDWLSDQVPVNEVIPLSRFCTKKGRQVGVRNAGLYEQIIILRRNPQYRDLQLFRSFRAKSCAGIAGDALLMSLDHDKIYKNFLSIGVALPASGFPMHELAAQFMLLKALGAELEGENELNPPIPRDKYVASAVRTYIGKTSIPVMVFAPCGSHSVRDWNPDKHTKLFASLPPMHYVVVGGKRDEAYIEKIKFPGNGSRVLNLIGKTTLREFTEWIRIADVVLTAESGGFHLAVSLRRPVLCIAGGGHWGRFVPWGDPSITKVLTYELPCFFCSWKCVRPTVDCIQGVSVEEVQQAIVELLSSQVCEK